jgi:plastocyanin
MAKVNIKGMKYDPPVTTINVGDTVEWFNHDKMLHTATADDGSWDTGDIPQNQSRSWTFKTVGDFPYYCTHHPDTMQGKVAVKGKP